MLEVERQQDVDGASGHSHGSAKHLIEHYDLLGDANGELLLPPGGEESQPAAPVIASEKRRKQVLDVTDSLRVQLHHV